MDEARFPRFGDGILLDLKDVELPVRNIVSAIGFESWEVGRGVNQAGGTETTSAESLRKYEAMDPNTRVIHDAYVYVTSDNVPLILSANAHRTGAAVNTGAEKIKFFGRLEVRKMAYTAEEMGVTLEAA